MSARLYRQMEIGWIFVFVFVGVALNLLIAGATGRVYEFWSGRRGSGKIVMDLKSPLARLALSCLGALFFVVALFLALHLLGGWQRVPLWITLFEQPNNRIRRCRFLVAAAPLLIGIKGHGVPLTLQPADIGNLAGDTCKLARLMS
jgi:hypothetical protein